jgi:hypothetical protein
VTQVTSQRTRGQDTTINQGTILLVLGLGAVILAPSLGSQTSSPWLVAFVALAGMATMWIGVVILFRVTRIAKAISQARSRL